MLPQRRSGLWDDEATRLDVCIAALHARPVRCDSPDDEEATRLYRPIARSHARVMAAPRATPSAERATLPDLEEDATQDLEISVDVEIAAPAPTSEVELTFEKRACALVDDVAPAGPAASLVPTTVHALSPVVDHAGALQESYAAQLPRAAARRRLSRIVAASGFLVALAIGVSIGVAIFHAPPPTSSAWSSVGALRF